MKSFSKYLKRFILVELVFIFILISSGVFGVSYEAIAANECIPLQVKIPGVGSCVRGFPEYIKGIYNLFISSVGVLAVIMIMVGGFQWLLAAGNAQKIAGAKATIISAVMGLVLALASYTILGLINPQLLNLNLAVTPLKNIEYNNASSTPSSYVYCQDSYDHDCGETYKGGNNIQCYGVWCSVLLFNWPENTCVISQLSCEASIDIPQMSIYGYETDWTFDEDGRTCGILYASRYVYNDKSRVIGGGDCTSGVACVVDLSSGVVPLDGQQEIIRFENVSGDNMPIARLANARCVPGQ